MFEEINISCGPDRKGTQAACLRPLKLDITYWKLLLLMIGAKLVEIVSRNEKKYTSW
jgi:hypothetical protein